MGNKPRAPREAPRHETMGLRETGAALREYALSLPGAKADYPWGEMVAKVRGKVFAFFGRERDQDDYLGLSVKLPLSGPGVLQMPFAMPTGYGLGSSGWISIRATADEPLPLELLCAWVQESYRAIAPKRLSALLPDMGPGVAMAPQVAKR